MKETNVLLTCAGRRNYLVGLFAQALGARGKVFAADARSDAPALHEAAEGFVVPAVGMPGYVKALLGICRLKGISMLVPTNDLELPVLARDKELFASEGVTIVVSAPAVIDICFDKLATAKFLDCIGVAGPRSYIVLEEAEDAVRKGILRMPLVLKPRRGSASIGIEEVSSMDALRLNYSSAIRRLRSSILGSANEGEHALIIQERLCGQEHGLDVVNDLSGNYLTTLVRRKLSMRAGETDRAVSVVDPRLEQIGRRVSASLRHVGVLDCDAFIDGDRIAILEMNPRFGGGYPFSHMAGANIPAVLVAMLHGEGFPVKWLASKAGVTSAKCDRLVACSGVSA